MMRDIGQSLTDAKTKLRDAERVTNGGGFDDIVIQLCRQAKEEAARVILSRVGADLQHRARAEGRVLEWLEGIGAVQSDLPCPVPELVTLAGRRTDERTRLAPPNPGDAVKELESAKAFVQKSEDLLIKSEPEDMRGGAVQ